MQIGTREDADRVEREHGTEVAVDYYKVATRLWLPVSLAVKMWLSEADAIETSTRNKYEKHVLRFAGWANDPDVDAVDRRLAGRYVSHMKSAVNPQTGALPAYRTVKSNVSSLSGLWTWLEKRGRLKAQRENPWARQVGAVPGQRSQKNGREVRAITREEARKWLAAAEATEQAQADLIILGWHTGIRANDICELTSDRVVWDEKAKAYWLTIEGGKTEANARVLPVVSQEAIAVLERRLKAAEDSILFHELEPKGPDKKRYWGIQKRINYQRKKVLGSDAPLDFHSLRRAFSVACEDAGLDPVLVSRLMGHEAPTLAAAVYNKGHVARARMLKGIQQTDKVLGELARDT